MQYFFVQVVSVCYVRPQCFWPFGGQCLIHHNDVVLQVSYASESCLLCTLRMFLAIWKGCGAGGLRLGGLGDDNKHSSLNKWCRGRVRWERLTGDLGYA